MLAPASRHPALWLTAAMAVIALVAATAALSVAIFARPAFLAGGMMGSGFGYGPGMMGAFVGAAEPGSPGFVAGTPASPRVVRVIAGPGYTFTPSTIAVARGETVTFLVSTMGPVVHEFMVGPADAVSADRAGTPEVSDIGMMQSKAVTYTFDGSGPYAFACHADGHFEAGMRGPITIVG